MALELISRAGRSPQGRTLVLARCSCGNEVTIRKDKAKRQQTCGNCNVALPARLVVRESQPVPSTAPVASVAPTFGLPERTPEYLQAEILSKVAALRKLDEQIADLTRLLAQEGVQPAGLDGESAAHLFRETVTTANVLRKEKQRLEKELRDLSGQKVAPMNSAEGVLARARLMRRPS